MASRHKPPGWDHKALAHLSDAGSLSEALSLPTTGWRAGMDAVTLTLLGDALETISSPLLEVGCGDGALASNLHGQHLGQRMIGLDLHPPHPPPSFPFPFVQADAQQLPYADNTIGALLAMDVFDQRGVKLAAALAESRRVLVPGGLLLLRVSAHRWLYGPHDVAFNTGRRYGRGELMESVITAGFRAERWTYANTLLTPLLIPQRLLQRGRIIPWRLSVYQGGWSNRLVARALKTEARWLQGRNLPFGLSLVVAARKPMAG